MDLVLILAVGAVIVAAWWLNPLGPVFAGYRGGGYFTTTEPVDVIEYDAPVIYAEEAEY